MMDEIIKQNESRPIRVKIDDGDVWIEQHETGSLVDIVIVDFDSLGALIELLNKAKKELE